MTKIPLSRNYLLTIFFFGALALFSFWGMLEFMYIKKQNAIYMKLFDDQANQYEFIQNASTKKISDNGKQKKKVKSALIMQQLEKNKLQDKLKHIEAEKIDCQHKYSEIITKQNNGLKPLPSLKLSDEEFHKSKYHNDQLNITMLTIPKNLYSDRRLTELEE
ncbi:hypothetical protein BB561_006737, partial [Smittium simulii]